ncbi:MAG: hypothetical protein D6797_05120 [Bdellovibrio sp.]|nr:MAG: hypothetical protein D6797_05120 [Bdellovibrio sp.]
MAKEKIVFSSIDTSKTRKYRSHVTPVCLVGNWQTSQFFKQQKRIKTLKKQQSWLFARRDLHS